MSVKICEFADGSINIVIEDFVSSSEPISRREFSLTLKDIQNLPTITKRQLDGRTIACQYLLTMISEKLLIFLTVTNPDTGSTMISDPYVFEDVLDEKILEFLNEMPLKCTTLHDLFASKLGSAEKISESLIVLRIKDKVTFEYNPEKGDIVIKLDNTA